MPERMQPLMKGIKSLVRMVKEEKLLVLVGVEVKSLEGMKFFFTRVEWCQLVCELEFCFYFAGKMSMW